MERLDKFLCANDIGTRSEVKNIIKKGHVKVNGIVVKDNSLKINPETDSVSYLDKEIHNEPFVYFMLNKPAGYVSATKDSNERTVLDLIDSKELHYNELFPVGRLDKDTEGLLLITNDGRLSHDLLSPTKHVAKLYEVIAQNPLNMNDVLEMESGLDIGDDKPTKPAKVCLIDDAHVHLTIPEGRYHQVKRMFEAINNKVLCLKRLRMGGLWLDSSLKPGEYRRLTTEEIISLQARIPKPKDYKAIIFDVDGTMVDSMGMWKHIDRDYLKKFQIPLPSDLQSEIEGISFLETAQYFKKRFLIEDSLEKIMSDWNEMAYEQYKNHIVLKDGVREVLEYCLNNNIKLGIATSNSRELMTLLAHKHHLETYMQCIVTGSEVPKGKPEPDIYLEVAAKLNVDPKDCLVFEDLVAGIMSAKAAGMRTCAVQDAYSMDKDREKRELADYYIESFYDIILK